MSKDLPLQNDWDKLTATLTSLCAWELLALIPWQ